MFWALNKNILVYFIVHITYNKCYSVILFRVSLLSNFTTSINPLLNATSIGLAYQDLPLCPRGLGPLLCVRRLLQNTVGFIHLNLPNLDPHQSSGVAAQCKGAHQFEPGISGWTPLGEPLQPIWPLWAVLPYLPVTTFPGSAPISMRLHTTRMHPFAEAWHSHSSRTDWRVLWSNSDMNSWSAVLLTRRHSLNESKSNWLHWAAKRLCLVVTDDSDGCPTFTV